MPEQWNQQEVMIEDQIGLPSPHFDVSGTGVRNRVQ